MRRALSLRVIVMVTIFIVGFLSVEGFHRFLIYSYRESQVEEQQVNLSYFATRLSGQLSLDESGSLYISPEMESEMNLLSDLNSGRILIISPDYRIVKDSFMRDENKTVVSSEIFQCFDGKSYTNTSRNEHYIELAIPVTDSVTKEVIAAIYISSSTTDIYNNVSILDQRVSFVEIFLILLVALLSFIIGYGIAAPFSRLKTSLERVSQGDLEAPLYRSHLYDLSELTDELESVLLKVRNEEQTRQEFVSNVSHELKTPIASMKVLSDSLLYEEGDVPPEVYRDFLTDITEEIDREAQIIDDLLTLTKLDQSSTDSLVITNISMNNMIEQVMRRLRPLAQKDNIELVFESNREVSADVDESKLSLAFTNLIENAIKYNRENGTVRVTLDADYKYAYVKIADSGIGIPEEEIPHIFDRFYRVDKARSRESGGTGLGLSIAQNIILLHSGAIRVTSVVGEGTTFMVRIPLNYLK